MTKFGKNGHFFKWYWNKPEGLHYIYLLTSPVDVVWQNSCNNIQYVDASVNVSRKDNGVIKIWTQEIKVNIT